SRPTVELLEDRINPSTPAIGLFNTGVDAGGAVLADGAFDPHYTLITSADPGNPGPASFVANQTHPNPFDNWLADTATSKWIAPSADQVTGNPAGTYTYQTTFDLTGVNPASVEIAGQWAADNTGTDIILNGTHLGFTSPGFNAFTPFTL